MKRAFTENNQSGFSLVELMIVVGIIGILATLALPRFQQFQAKAKMGEAKNMLTHIYTLEQSFHLDNNDYKAFDAYGRKTDGSVNCDAPPQGAKDIGFQINPCTTAGDPVPRFGYSVERKSRSEFVATAATGEKENNMVCPGSGALSITMNQNKSMSGSTAALAACTNTK